MIYFISDIHLGLEKRELDIERENLLINFLRKIKNDCEILFIVGDLFDYWFEYKTVIPKFYTRTLAALLDLHESGIKIEYLMGNHDFGHIDYFEKELGIPIYKDDIERTLGGKRFYISHGDGKANNDAGYRFMKKILRNKISMKLFQFIHPDYGIALAKGSSRKSRRYTDQKNFGPICGMKEFAEQKINEGFDFVIMGHRHRAEYAELPGGIYINLGAWTKEPLYAVFDGGKLELKRVGDFVSK
jgi:UDP-2,3-diacylglucosamine hydrolase